MNLIASVLLQLFTLRNDNLIKPKIGSAVEARRTNFGFYSA
jgi:hypothetical protein